MNIPTVFTPLPQVKLWLSKIKKKYQDDWKVAVWKTITQDGISCDSIHKEVLKHLNRKKP